LLIFNLFANAICNIHSNSSTSPSHNLRTQFAIFTVTVPLVLPTIWVKNKLDGVAAYSVFSSNANQVNLKTFVMALEAF